MYFQAQNLHFASNANKAQQHIWYYNTNITEHSSSLLLPIGMNYFKSYFEERKWEDQKGLGDYGSYGHPTNSARFAVYKDEIRYK